MSYHNFKQTYHVNLNNQQEEAVQAINGYVMLLAVPGSGKTTVLINRLGYMVLDQGISPQNILTVTYTVAATNDMRNRFESQFGSECGKDLEFRTINSLSQKILDYYGSITGKKAFAVIENSAKAAVIKNIFKLINNAFATENDIKNIESAIAYVKNMRLSEEQIEKYDAEIDEFPKIYKEYQRELRNQGLIDFDDQIVYAQMLLQKVPAVLDYFQSKYQYICVDEAQDTSKLQHDMINLLASKNGNLFMVGDEDQSIYGFRAAYPEALLSFEKTHPGAKVLLMESNYRSKEEIVEIADKFIQSNKKRHEKRMKATKSEGGSVTNTQVKSRKEQFSYLLKVAKNCEKETAVLYRNNESALPLIDMLEREGVSYRMKNNDMTFFSHPVVNDITDFITLSLNPEDADAFLRIYYKMGAGINKINANLVVDGNLGNHSLLDAIDDLDGISAYTRKQCRALSTHFTNMRQESAGKAIYRILHYMGYGDYLSEHSMDYGKAEILQMLAEQVDNLENFIPRLEQLKELISQHKSPRESQFILSTIHSSKGLEYDTVYMLDVVEGILPSISEPKGKKVNEADVSLYEEERRLFYVGMTRAKTSLHIFTFKGAETSSFSKSVFGINAPTESRMQFHTQGRTQLKTQLKTKSKSQAKIYISNYTDYSSTRKSDMSSNESSHDIIEGYEKGTAIIHKKYGEGTVVGKEGNNVEIYLDEFNETKKFALDKAIAKGLIRVK